MSLRGTVQKVTHTSQATYDRRRAGSRARLRPGAACALLAVLALILALVAALVAFGGRGGESVEDARAAADSALEQVDQLTARVESLATDLGVATAALDEAEKSDRSLAAQLDKAAARLDKALVRLRKRADAAGAAAESAAASSSSALAKAEAAARGLNVLQERYDYHLRRYHGGG